MTGGFLAALLAVAGGIVGFYFCSLVVAYIAANAAAEPVNTLPFDMRKRLLPCLIVAGFALLFVCSVSVSIWSDEAFTLRIIQYSYPELIQYTAADVHPPLYYILLKFVEDICSGLVSGISTTIIIGKFFSVISYVLTAVLCWKKLTASESKTIAEMAALCLIAVLGIAKYGVEIRMYGWALFFVTGTYLYAKDIMENKGTVKHWLLLVFFSLCSAYTHNFALIEMAAVWLYLLIWSIRNQREAIKRWFIFGIATVVGYFPWLMVLISQMQTVADDYWIGDIDISTVSHYIAGVLPGCLIFVLVAAGYTVYSQRKKDESSWSGIVGILIPATTIVAGLVISIILRPILVDRYLVPATLCLWIGVLLIWQKMSRGNQVLVVSILAISFAGSCLSLAVTECGLGVKAANKSLALIESMEKDSVIFVDEGALYVVAAYTDKMVYYTDGNSENTVYGAIFSNVEEIDYDAEAFISELLDEGTSVYYFTSGDVEYNWDNGRCTLLGTYDFSTDSTVYQITPLADSGGADGATFGQSFLKERI